MSKDGMSFMVDEAQTADDIRRARKKDREAPRAARPHASLGSTKPPSGREKE